MSGNHDEALEFAWRASRQSKYEDVRRAVIAFLREWEPRKVVIGSGHGAAEYTTEAKFYARLTADELEGKTA